MNRQTLDDKQTDVIFPVPQMLQDIKINKNCIATWICYVCAFFTKY